ncbi:uncharacterized protein LOC129536644 isoform X9 [Moschus berezovskii]|uniref:uncharacterized protein LOC129536644 isoform X9 n=1 Tax=Moschus berezovskii TaxID=68408 RepID=UPI00244483C1|nr:uncharacterized protein LOC129536644 isoform X9 [Moschus berezovskii]
MARTWLGAVASPPLPKGSLASTLRALDHSRAELSSTRSTSPRGPGQGRQPGPLRGPQCPGMAQGRPLLSLTKLPCHPQSCPEPVPAAAPEVSPQTPLSVTWYERGMGGACVC